MTEMTIWRQRNKIKKLRDRKESELRQELRDRQSADFTFHPRITNLSDTTFSNEEMDLLSRGHKYAPARSVNLSRLAIEVEDAIRRHPQEDEIRSELIECLKRAEKQKQHRAGPHYHCNTINNTIKNIKQKLATTNTITTLADKNAGLVILNERDYVGKTEEFFAANNFIEIKRNPTNSFHSRVKKIIEKHKEFFRQHNTNTFFLTPMNPRTPLLYSLVKLHKTGHPIRPIITSISSSTHKLAQFVLNFFNEHIKFSPRYGILNAAHLINNLESVDLPNDFTMLSFDVSNLYNNVPVRESIRLARKIVVDRLDDEEIANTIEELLTVCTDQNFCQFNNKLYKYSDGLPMGGSLSGLLADIFLDSLEKDLLDVKNDVNGRVLVWQRYVDDVLVLWEGGDEQENIHSFHDHINNLHDNLNFTLELEHNNRINFLDVSIIRENGSLSYDIYRKPTQTDSIIPFDSFHHISQRFAALNSYLHRCYSLPLNKERRMKEIDCIREIAYNNGFSTSTFNNILKKHTQKFHNKNTTSLLPLTQHKTNKIYRTISFPGNISFQLNNIFKKFNFTISYKTSNTVKDRLFNAKDKIPDIYRSGVYRLNCNTCCAAYIGETGRSFKKRISEHVDKIGVNTGAKPKRSNFGAHLRDHKHSFNENTDVQFLHFLGKGHQLELLEHYEINKFLIQNPHLQCLNDQLYTPKPPLYTYLKHPFPKLYPTIPNK